MLGPIRRLLAAAFDRLDTPRVRVWLERAVVAGAAARRFKAIFPHGIQHDIIDSTPMHVENKPWVN